LQRLPLRLGHNDTLQANVLFQSPGHEPAASLLQAVVAMCAASHWRHVHWLAPTFDRLQVVASAPPRGQLTPPLLPGLSSRACCWFWAQLRLVDSRGEAHTVTVDFPAKFPAAPATATILLPEATSLLCVAC
jgi:hypothetical protein